MISEELRSLLNAHRDDFSQTQLENTLKFHEILVLNNEAQNLTRLTSPRDFYEGHFLDVLELKRSGLVGTTSLDLGSGCGVPGLLATILGVGKWSLAESEGRKAEFLSGAVEELGLDLPVFPDRGEKLLRKTAFDQVVVRAVGKVAKIYPWIAACSTWNTLLLFKGPGWAAEWDAFQETEFKNQLAIEKIHAYSVGAEAKQRVIVLLRNVVPRGTRE